MTNQLNRVDVGGDTPPAGSLITKSIVFFQRHWKRGAPGKETPEWVVNFAYSLWLVALLLKLVGSSWDMSWHFRWLRDDLAPPHLLNTAGTVMVCALVLVHTYTGLGCDKRSLRLMQIGTVTFLIAAPLDVINHRISGLDLTAWSPTHMLLFIGTAVMVLGVIDGWLKFSAPGRGRTLTAGALWVFFLENVYFPNGQQEYGILALRSWERGEPDAEPQLLHFAREQLGSAQIDAGVVRHFALPIENWVYPAWGIGVIALVLVAARATTKARWTATAVAAGYVAYRAAIWPMLVGTGFPASTVPFYLLFVGLAVDIAFLLGRGRGLYAAAVGGPLVAALGFGALWAQSQLRPWLFGEDAITESAPPVDYWTVPLVLVGVSLVWAAGSYGTRRWNDRMQRTAAMPDSLV